MEEDSAAAVSHLPTSGSGPLEYMPLKERILTYVIGQGPIRTYALSKEVGVTPMKCRRLLDELEAEGKVTRVIEGDRLLWARLSPECKSDIQPLSLFYSRLLDDARKEIDGSCAPSTFESAKAAPREFDCAFFANGDVQIEVGGSSVRLPPKGAIDLLKFLRSIERLLPT